jgi:hypothetical protein
MAMTIFTISMDRTTKITTILVSALLAVLVAIHFSVFDTKFWYFSVINASLLPSLYLLAFLFCPIHYQISSNALLIRRYGGNVLIDRTEIKEVKAIDPANLRKSVRIFGVGGLFGHYGKYANQTLGSMRWYATRKNNTVLLLTHANEKIILTPDAPEQFIAALQQT